MSKAKPRAAGSSEISQEMLSLLGKLARRGAFVRPTAGSDPGEQYCDLYTPTNGFKMQAASVDRNTVETAIRSRFLLQDSKADRWSLSPKGKTVLRCRRSSGDGPIGPGRVDIKRGRPQAGFAKQGSAPGLQGGRRQLETPVAPGSARVQTIDLAESPLGWLRRRKGRDGRPLLNDAAFHAGEKLREDFWLAQITPRVTSDWSTQSVSRGKRRAAPGQGVELSERATAAQQRVQKALQAVGPELSGVLIDVCCHLKGLEVTEKESGWPQRSGKVVLVISLRALARHYGLSTQIPPSAGDGGNGGRGSASVNIRHWGASGYRPVISQDQ